MVAAPGLEPGVHTGVGVRIPSLPQEEKRRRKNMAFEGFRKQLRKWKDKFGEKKETYREYTPSRGGTFGTKYDTFLVPETIKDVLAPKDYSNVFMNIYEINLLHMGYCKNFNREPALSWIVLKDVYDKILRDDPFWHFFYEGEYSIIRCSGEFTAGVCDLLDEFSVVYTEPTVWYDSSEYVKYYHTVFTYLFHGFSVLAMEYPNEEWFVVSDRVIHCYMNHQWYRDWAQWFRKCWGEELWETMALSEHAARRTNYRGYCDGIARGKAAANKEWQDWADKDILDK